jgi:hypothetical protein
MAPKYKRVIIPLDDTATEALAALSGWLGVGEDTLAKRLLSATLHVIAAALETQQETGEAPESEPEESGEWEGMLPDSYIELSDGTLEPVYRLGSRKPQ